MIKIIADSTCDLTDEILQRYDIDILPLYIHLGEKEYKDRLEIQPEDIFSWSNDNNTTPKTAAPSIEDAVEAMKPYVEKIETEAMYAEKSWGTYTVIDVQPGSMTVKVSMRAGEHMTYHMHNYREEVWTIVSGKGKAIVDGMEQVLRTGDVITIAAGCKHTVEAITTLDMIEVQLGEEISVTDKIKFPMK